MIGRKELLDKNPLTPQEAADLAEVISKNEAKDCARLILLCHAFTYEKDIMEREEMLRDIEARLGPLLPCFDDMQRADMLVALKEIKKGGDAR